jgi:hypothetical protein
MGNRIFRSVSMRLDLQRRFGIGLQYLGVAMWYLRDNFLIIPPLLFATITITILITANLVNKSPIFIPLVLFYSLVMIVVLAFVVSARVNLKRFQRRRKAAFSAGLQQRLESAGQPLPTQALPTELELHARRSFILTYSGGFSLLLGIPLGIIIGLMASISTTTIFEKPNVVVMQLILFIIISAVCSWMIIWIQLSRHVSRYLFEKIELTTDGIRVQRGYMDQYIAWDSIALFAQIPVSPIRASSRYHIFYELSDQETTVRFFSITHSHSRYQPSIPYQDYERCMQKILSYIAARTGLSLVDISTNEGERKEA